MKHLFAITLLFSALSGTSQNTFYISNKGSNANPGTSPSGPLSSITYLQPGHTYLLNRGDTFYFNIYQVANADPSGKITISSYGAGAKPVISIYKVIRPAAWENHAANIWKVDLTDTDNYTGFTPVNTNIGFMKVNGVVFGKKLSGIPGLAAQWDFYADNTHLYTYSTTDPSALDLSIEVSCNVDAVNLSDNMEISDIAIQGTGAHAINGNNSKNVVLRNIDITEIGGSFLPGYGNGTTRYGNGIQFWNGSDNCLIEGCRVSKVYDVAFTMQGNGANTAFVNTTFQNNAADSNEQSLEMWVSGNAPGFTNCQFINNTCSNAGMGWSHALRPDQHVGVHILTYAWEVKNSDVRIEGNTFYRARSGLYYWGYVWDPMPGFTSSNNIVFLDANTFIRSLIDTYTIENAESFVAHTGKETGSVFNSITPGPQVLHKSRTTKFPRIPYTSAIDQPPAVQSTATSGSPQVISGSTSTPLSSGSLLGATGLRRQ